MTVYEPRMEQKCSAPKNKPEFMGIVLQILSEFWLIFEGVASDSTVYLSLMIAFAVLVIIIINNKNDKK